MNLKISKKDFKDTSTTALTKLVQGIIREKGEMKYQELANILGSKLHTLQTKVPSKYLSIEDADDLFEMEIPSEILSDKDLTAFQKLVYGFKYSFKSITSKKLLERFNEFGMFQHSIFRKQVLEIFTDGRVTYQNFRWNMGKFQSKESEPIDNTTQDRNDWKSANPAQESASIESTSSDGRVTYQNFRWNMGKFQSKESEPIDNTKEDSNRWISANPAQETPINESTSSKEKELLERIKNLEQSLKEKDDEIEVLKVRNRCLEQESREQTHLKCEVQKKLNEITEYSNKMKEHARSCDRELKLSNFKFNELKEMAEETFGNYEVEIVNLKNQIHDYEKIINATTNSEESNTVKVENILSNYYYKEPNILNN